MAKPLTNQERDEIARLLEAGQSHAEIARTVGRATGTIANIAKSIGWSGDQSRALRVRKANENRSAYSADRRAELAARATERAQEMLERWEAPYLVFNFGGRDNDYNEHQLAEAPIEAKRAMAQTFRDLMRTVIEIDRHDNRQDEGLSAVDEWLRGIVGDAVAA